MSWRWEYPREVLGDGTLIAAEAIAYATGFGTSGMGLCNQRPGV